MCENLNRNEQGRPPVQVLQPEAGCDANQRHMKSAVQRYTLRFDSNQPNYTMRAHRGYAKSGPRTQTTESNPFDTVEGAVLHGARKNNKNKQHQLPRCSAPHSKQKSIKSNKTNQSMQPYLHLPGQHTT